MNNSVVNKELPSRMTWQRPTLVRMGAADAEGTQMMSMVTDADTPRRMMGS